MIYVKAPDVQVGDVIWDKQEMTVTKVKHLSYSTAITAQYNDRVGPEYGSVQWLIEDWQNVPVTREDNDGR